jgi:hypothetical protein
MTIKLSKKDTIRLNTALDELNTLKYVGNMDFLGLENNEGFKVSETINNRLEFPIKVLQELLE